MKGLINLAELRANIGDDIDVERSLLMSFVESTGESLQALDALLAEEGRSPQDWRTHMHRIKGAALNIGAAKLASLATIGQEMMHGDLPTKRQALGQVREALEEVERCIGKAHPKLL